jgi:RNA polymerase sigma-70 factor (ECF subfamily)
MKMKNATKSIPMITMGAALAGLAATLAMPARAVDLLERYPTTLTAGVLEAGQARRWQITPSDIFRVSRFRLEVGTQLKVETGPADLGIGHCADGAVCAMLIPADGGKLTRRGAASAEEVAHIWLRFHPGEINKLFPPDTVSPAQATGVISQMRDIIRGKFRASYHAGNNAMIPEPKDMTVDVDTKAGPRRFFMVDTQAKTAQYVNAFEGQPVRLAAAAPGAAESAAAAPKIIATTPADGAEDVDPGLTEITVTFDQDMGGGFSWTGGGPEFPTTPRGAKARWQDKRTCVLPVKLEPGHHYRVGINSPSYRNFSSVAGESVEPSSINFTTK